MGVQVCMQDVMSSFEDAGTQEVNLSIKKLKLGELN